MHLDSQKGSRTYPYEFLSVVCVCSASELAHEENSKRIEQPVGVQFCKKMKFPVEGYPI